MRKANFQLKEKTDHLNLEFDFYIIDKKSNQKFVGYVKTSPVLSNPESFNEETVTQSMIEAASRIEFHKTNWFWELESPPK